MNYYHVDVFSAKPLSGNGLTVIFPEETLSAKMMLEIAREFKQFESIFIRVEGFDTQILNPEYNHRSRTNKPRRVFTRSAARFLIFPSDADGIFPARIFTVDEELMFAGHPILGAGAVIHQAFFPDQQNVGIVLQLGERSIPIQSGKKDDHYEVMMNQGKAEFIKRIEESHHTEIAESLNLTNDDIDQNYPIEVVSTGLPYLLVPIQSGIDKSKIMHDNFEKFLSRFAAKFVYIFDTKTLECRTWDNIAHTEDIATGSAAGPLCAYLVKHEIKKHNEMIHLHQGRFVNRPSVITGWVLKNGNEENVFITGNVSFFSSGKIAI